MPNYALIIINATVAFIYLFIVSKLLGKKQIAQMEFIDYVVGISLGSIAAEMSAEADDPWWYYIIAMTVFFLLSVFVTFLGRKTPFFKKLLKGKPEVIISEGKLNYENLKKSKMDVNDVLALCRNAGYFDINDVAYAIFETNGQLSVLPIGREKPVTISDIGKEPKQASLTNIVLIDGTICRDALKYLKKSEAWLLNRLNVKTEKELKQFLLIGYNEEKDKLDVHYKDPSKNKNKATIENNKTGDNTEADVL